LARRKWRAQENAKFVWQSTSQKDHIEEIFEGTIQQKPDKAEQDFTCSYDVPLRSGIYRINVVVRDAAEDRKGTWSGAIMVP
jgi:hypothetical protein